MKYISERPRVKVINKTIEGKVFDISNYVLQFRHQADIDSAATFEMELILSPIDKDGPKFTAGNMMSFFLKTLKKNDLLSIGVQTEGFSIIKIDSIRRSKSSGPNRFERKLSVTGRNLASLFIDDNIVFAPNLATSTQVIKLLGKQRAEFLGLLRGMGQNGDSQFVNRPPLEVILWICLNMPSIHMNVMYADYTPEGDVNSIKPDKIGKYFTFDLKQYAEDKVFDPNLAMYSNSVWSYFHQCVDRQFYEIFVDCKTDEAGAVRPCLFVRPKPWDRTTDFNEAQKIIAPTLNDFNITGAGDDNAPQVEVKIKGDPPNYKWQWDKQDLMESNTNTTTGNTVVRENLYQVMMSNKEKPTYFHTIREEDIYEEDIISSTMDIVNFITMNPTKDILSNTVLSQYGYLFPLIGCDSVKRNGMRSLPGITNLFQDNELVKPDDPRAKELTLKEGKDYIIYGVGINYQRRRDQLWNWYKFNEIFYASCKRVKGNDSYRIGDKFYFPDEVTEEGHQGVFYYCRNISQECIQNKDGARYFTTLNLIRGENEKYLQEYLSKISEETSTVRINLGAKGNTAGTVNNTNNNTGSNANSNVDKKYGNLVNGMIDIITNGYKANESRFQKFATQYSGDPELKFTMSAESLINLISDQAKYYSIDANVVASMINHESVFNPEAVSHSGCTGLGQFSKPTAEDVPLWSKYPMFANQQKTKKLQDIRYHPVLNIKAMCYTLKFLKKWGDSLKSQVRAICSYGDNKQRSYFSLTLSDLKKYVPSHPLFTDEAKGYANSFYDSMGG